ncbi:MAG: hypothetical protein IJ566_08000 [Cardiobacteriaceae bacterium]|nr:hypothetical protein [Cardiobacteriaceae bacterium]
MKKSTALIIISLITAVILVIVAVLLMRMQIREASNPQAVIISQSFNQNV